jgi:hypothetical protein
VSIIAVASRLFAVGGDGLQDIAAVASEHVRFVSISLLATATLSCPTCQVESHPLFTMLLFIVFAHVAPSLCPSALSLQVALSWPLRTRYPCVQQYPSTAKYDGF